MKLRDLFLASLAALTFASCQDETPLVDEFQPKTGNNIVTKVNITVPETKAVKKAWATGDKLNIWYGTNEDDDYVQYEPGKTKQGYPDLVLTYSSEGEWVVGADELSTRGPEASGTFKVLYEGFNDWHDQYYHNAGTPNGETYINIGDYSNYSYKTPMMVYSNGVEYTYDSDSGELTAAVTSWNSATPVQVVITGINAADCDNYVLRCGQLYSAAGCLIKSDGITYNASSSKSNMGYWQRGVPNADGVAFYFRPNGNQTTTFSFYLFDKVNSTVSICDVGGTINEDYTKCKSIKINVNDFKKFYAGMVDGYAYSVAGHQAYLQKYNYFGSGATRYSGAVTVPSSITVGGVNYPVIAIGSYAFAGSSGITSITLPEGIQSIGGYAFTNLSITTLVIPSTVTFIDNGNAVFNGNPNLQLSVAAGNTMYFMENGCMYENYNKVSGVQYYRLMYVPETMTGDLVLKDNTARVTSNGTLRTTALSSIEFPASYNGNTWGCFTTIAGEELELKFNFADYAAFNSAFGTFSLVNFGNNDANAAKIVISVPASWSDADLASLQTWSQGKFKDVRKRAAVE